MAIEETISELSRLCEAGYAPAVVFPQIESLCRIVLQGSDTDRQRIVSEVSGFARTRLLAYAGRPPSEQSRKDPAST